MRPRSGVVRGLTPACHCDTRGPWVLVYATRDSQYEMIRRPDADAYLWFTLGSSSQKAAPPRSAAGSRGGSTHESCAGERRH